jgi:hypothetical protein
MPPSLSKSRRPVSPSTSSLHFLMYKTGKRMFSLDFPKVCSKYEIPECEGHCRRWEVSGGMCHDLQGFWLFCFQQHITNPRLASRPADLGSCLRVTVTGRLQGPWMAIIINCSFLLPNSNLEPISEADIQFPLLNHFSEKHSEHSFFC